MLRTHAFRANGSTSPDYGEGSTLPYSPSPLVSVSGTVHSGWPPIEQFGSRTRCQTYRASLSHDHWFLRFGILGLWLLNVSKVQVSCLWSRKCAEYPGTSRRDTIDE